MPITASSTFNAVVLWCDCGYGDFRKHWVQQGTSQAAREGNEGLAFSSVGFIAQGIHDERSSQEDLHIYS